MVALLALSVALAAATPAYTPWSKVDRSSLISTARAFFPLNPTPVRIRLLSVSGDRAIVTYANGEIESRRWSGKLLLERFSFGWQVVGEEITPVSAGDLYRRTYDSGPTRDRAAVRQQLLDMQNQAVGPARIWAGFAMVDWGGNGGGEVLLRKLRGRWVRITGSGGELRAADLVREYHVPPQVAKCLKSERPCRTPL